MQTLQQTEKSIDIPYRFTPRPYQRRVYECFDNGCKRIVRIWHRRAGKDRTFFNLMIREAVKQKGVYYYLLPTAKQGRKIIWDGIDARTGMKFVDHIPKEILDKKNETDMKLTLWNGSIIQVIGTDDYDAIMGTNPIGIVLSEYSIQDPRVWDYLRPILAENGGWAAFNYTPRGKNHGYKLYKAALDNELWDCEILTVRETAREDGLPVITPEAIQEELLSGMDQDLVQQEFYCSFTGAVVGNYYGAQMATAEQENRITNVPHEPALPVDTWWDLGFNDAMAVWFTQQIGSEIRVIDYLEQSGEGLPYYANELKSRNYVYGGHNMPHDVRVSELHSGISREQRFKDLGINPINIIERAKDINAVNTGIEFCRTLLKRCWFDKERTARGRDCLENYRKKYDEINKVFINRPLHDWASNGADAFRTFGVGQTIKDLKYRRDMETKAVKGFRNMGIQKTFDPFAYI